jgi:hypothetical protein
MFFDLLGQDLRIINTKDLINISNTYGLDSALKMTEGIPIYYIDSLTAHELARQINKNTYSETIESFLVDFSLHLDFPELSEIINRFIDKKTNQIVSYEPNDLGELPEISNDELIAIIKRSNAKTDSFLINYYNSWLVKSTIFKDQYIKGINENNSSNSETLIKPFQLCNLNCYKILLALDSLKSNFTDKVKLQNHYSFLSEFDKRVSLYRYGDFIDYNKQVNPDTLILTKGYNSIGEIDFINEPELKDLQKGYIKSFCWKFLIYNFRTGYLDLGCQSGPLAGQGIMYRMELINNNMLKMTIIVNWIS